MLRIVETTRHITRRFQQLVDTRAILSLFNKMRRVQVAHDDLILSGWRDADEPIRSGIFEDVFPVVTLDEWIDQADSLTLLALGWPSLALRAVTMSRCRDEVGKKITMRTARTEVIHFHAPLAARALHVLHRIDTAARRVAQQRINRLSIRAVVERSSWRWPTGQPWSFGGGHIFAVRRQAPVSSGGLDTP